MLQMNRRSFLRFLGIAPVALPVAAQAIAAQSSAGVFGLSDFVPGEPITGEAFIGATGDAQGGFAVPREFVGDHWSHILSPNEIARMEDCLIPMQPRSLGECAAERGVGIDFEGDDEDLFAEA
jgi:hypothetical protein